MSASTSHENAAVARAAATAAAARALPATQEWLTFRLGEEEYGMDILRVQEIRSYEKPTPMANAPEHVVGIVNLRGEIVPILDLRARFGMADVHHGAARSIVVLNVAGRTVGVVVDSVSDVLELTPGDVKPFPGMGGSGAQQFITGIGSLHHDGRERVLILLNITALLAGIQA